MRKRAFLLLMILIALVFRIFLFERIHSILALRRRFATQSLAEVENPHLGSAVLTTEAGSSSP